MDDLQSEKEQLEEMRAWWKEYGNYVIAGVVIAVVGLVGFNQYKSSRLDAEMQASQLYESLATEVTDGNLEQAESVADELATNFVNTPYAAQSKLAMARLYMDKNRDQDAADVLSELLDMRANDEIKHIARLRLARVLLYQDKADEVVSLLSDQESPAFAARYSEVLGDAYVALGRNEDAATAYRAALADTTPNPTIDRALVQMKLVDLPQATVAASTDAGNDALPSTAPADTDEATP